MNVAVSEEVKRELLEKYGFNSDEIVSEEPPTKVTLNSYPYDKIFCIFELSLALVFIVGL